MAGMQGSNWRHRDDTAVEDGLSSAEGEPRRVVIQDNNKMLIAPLAQMTPAEMIAYFVTKCWAWGRGTWRPVEALTANSHRTRDADERRDLRPLTWKRRAESRSSPATSSVTHRGLMLNSLIINFEHCLFVLRVIPTLFLLLELDRVGHHWASFAYRAWSSYLKDSEGS
ncbi:hypothetical protein NDU88_006493 [Pleurodeles waltl]|uniref:Uncharacterized protein n=1 Tax=Pleurodeles waltl TaxID=8319 RepID=A0AAV7NQE5_PLEWA|nr:hypothetical protein NDU88_006493 [Pleurodeles waltl]